jgi:hypothetical protein
MTTYASPLAFRQALDARLRTSAMAAGSTIERVRQVLVFDRFLARVGAGLGERVVVKGGMAMELRLARARMTRDVDLRWSGPSTTIVDELRDAGRIDLGDFFTFMVAPHRAHPILRAEGMAYDGCRLTVTGIVAGKPYGLPFGVDIAIGDPLLEAPEILDGVDTLAFLGIPRASHRVYPRTTHLAEKLHAYTLPRDRENTRVKDLPDIALLASVGPMEATRLRAAIETTFKVRGTHPVCVSLPMPPSSWRGPYAVMAKADGLPWPELDDVFLAASAFLDPVLAGGVGSWSPPRGTWE